MDNKEKIEQLISVMEEANKDEQFRNKIESSKSLSEVYKLVTEKNNLSLTEEEFCCFFKNVDLLCESVGNKQELSTEELDAVVGGSWKVWNKVHKIFKSITAVKTLISLPTLAADIPLITSPVGIIKIIKDIHDVKEVVEVAKDYLKK